MIILQVSVEWLSSWGYIRCVFIANFRKEFTKFVRNYFLIISNIWDTNEVNNYRGIAISSCLSKLFTSILNERLMKYMSDNNLWRRNQCGFMKGHRTEDIIFILQTLFHKYAKNKKNKIFV